MFLNQKTEQPTPYGPLTEDEHYYYEDMIRYAKNDLLATLRNLCRLGKYNRELTRAHAIPTLAAALEEGHSEVADFLCSHFDLKDESKLTTQVNQSQESSTNDSPETHRKSLESPETLTKAEIKESKFYQHLIRYAEKGYLEHLKMLCLTHLVIKNYAQGRDKIALQKALEAGHHQIADFLCSHFDLEYEKRLVHQMGRGPGYKFIIKDNKKVGSSDTQEDQPETQDNGLYQTLIMYAESNRLEALKDLCHDHHLNKEQAQGRDKIALKKALKAGHDQVADFLCSYFGLRYVSHFVRQMDEPGRTEYVIFNSWQSAESLKAPSQSEIAVEESPPSPSGSKTEESTQTKPCSDSLPETDDEFYQMLTSYIENGDLESLKSLCRGSYSKERTRGRDKIALQMALAHGHFLMADFLCSYFNLTYERFISHEPSRFRHIIHDPQEENPPSTRDHEENLAQLKERIAQLEADLASQREAKGPKVLVQSNKDLIQAQNKPVLKSLDSKYRLLKSAIPTRDLELVKLVCQELKLTKSDLLQMPGILLLNYNSGSGGITKYLLTTYEF